MKHFNINVFGIVQGVGFRYNAIKQAKYHDINGFVRNESDGSVYIEAEGDDKALNEFVQWCRHGPAHASVTNINVEEGTMRNFEDFEARH
jgi:acylphosphatase